MTASIELENYRGFEKYRLDGLSRVNLLVGANSCGKTAILEAVHFLASDGDPSILAWIASQRGEVASLRDEESSRRRTYHSLLHFFHNRVFGLGATFSVRYDFPMAGGSIQVRVVSREDLDRDKHYSLRRLSARKGAFFAGEELFDSGFAVLIKGSHGSEFVCPVTTEGPIVEGSLVVAGVRDALPKNPPHAFVTTASLDQDSMYRMWDSVLEQGREGEVISAMQILEPDLSGLFFLQGASSAFGSSSGGIIVAFKGSRQRTPLGSHGEGMRRLLALSLALVQCKGGVLLIDEIDTGLHYSVMGDMWRLVVEAARRADVQVFATTHSSDCVRGLAWLCRNHPELGEEVSLQKIEPELEKAVGFDAEGIVSTDQHDIEVR